MFDNLFYNYHLFYQKILKDGTPIGTSVFALSASTCFILMTLFNITLVILKLNPLNKWHMMALLITILCINVYFYVYKKRANFLIKSVKKRKGKIFALLYFLFSLICLFFGPVLEKQIS